VTGFIREASVLVVRQKVFNRVIINIIDALTVI
jgi:hypothetical protein